jgi:hypothetical protein
MVMKFKLNTFFTFSLDGNKCSAASSKETAHNDHRVGHRASYNMVTTDCKSLPSGNQTHIHSLLIYTFLPHRRQYKVLSENP